MDKKTYIERVLAKNIRCFQVELIGIQREDADMTNTKENNTSTAQAFLQAIEKENILYFGGYTIGVLGQTAIDEKTTEYKMTMTTRLTVPKQLDESMLIILLNEIGQTYLWGVDDINEIELEPFQKRVKEMFPIETKDHEEVEALLEHIQLQKTMQLLGEEIDRSLDSGDKEAFASLSKRYAELKEQLTVPHQ